MDKKKNILLVDDEVDLVDLIKFQLKAKGYDVVTACDGLDALEKLKSVIPDLIILDVNMPRMGGLEFCNKITTAHGRLKYPVLILTARANLEKTLKDIDVDGFMPKPFEIDKLIAEVDRIMTSHINPIIFLVDFKENPHVKKICETFQNERYEIINVEDFRLLENNAQTKKPDFIILEYMQKGMNGDVFVQKIKESPFLKDAGVIVYSYSGFEGYGEKSLKAGADRYLNKPKDYNVFVTTIKELTFNKKNKN